MSATESSVSLANDPFPEGTVDAGIYSTHDAGFERGVVVLAMGESCWLIEAPDGHHVRVQPAALEAVRQQLGCYDRECEGWPPAPAVDAGPLRQRTPLSPWVWVLSIFGIFHAQEKWPALTDAALLDAGRVFDQGEWWRTGTALWLHGDLGHLVSNAGGGLLVFSAVVATFGLGAGWRRLIVSAATGNGVAVGLHHGEAYRSLGASTAVFAGLGLLAGRAVRVVSRSRHPHRWRTMGIPLAAGLAVLGLFGAGGVNIDVLAHATGFGSGLLIGFVTGGPEPLPPRRETVQ
jgi:membrane associated rhomboid family serine protease